VRSLLSRKRVLVIVDALLEREVETQRHVEQVFVGADPSFSVIKAYDAPFTIPVAGAVFAYRTSYVISPVEWHRHRADKQTKIFLPIVSLSLHLWQKSH
jgi:hypothetical protein